MSVICKILGTEHFTLYVKGAPEKIIDNCDASTVPPEFNELLKEYAIRGFRMIALAYKDLDVKLRWKDAQKIKREEVNITQSEYMLVSFSCNKVIFYLHQYGYVFCEEKVSKL